MKICIVVSDYYKDISENLLKGCINELKKRGYKNFNFKFVSGDFEIPKDFLCIPFASSLNFLCILCAPFVFP